MIYLFYNRWTEYNGYADFQIVYKFKIKILKENEQKNNCHYICYYVTINNFKKELYVVGVRLFLKQVSK